MRYFFPCWSPIQRPSRHIARDVQITGATKPEVILIERGHARNHHEARRLMTKYNARHALDVIQKLPRRRTTTFKDRLQSVMMRIAGEDRRDPLGVKPKEERVRYKVRYKR